MPSRFAKIKKARLGRKIYLLTALTILTLTLASVQGTSPKKPRILTQLSSPAPTAKQTIKPSPSPSPTPTPIPPPTAYPTAILSPTPYSAPESFAPALSPTVPPDAMPVSSHEQLFDQFSSQYKVDKELLKRIAQCESGQRPEAVNGPYGGMYQFLASTWQSTRASMNADTNPDLRFDAKAAIETAAFKIANGGQMAWANCL